MRCICYTHTHTHTHATKRYTFIIGLKHNYHHRQSCPQISSCIYTYFIINKLHVQCHVPLYNKNIIYASTRRNKGEKRKEKEERVVKHQFKDRYILYIYLHRILKCNLNTENIFCRSAPSIFCLFFILCENVKGGTYINCFNCFTIFRF